MEIILKIHAPELTNALMVLAEALDRRSNGIANATAILEKKKHGTNTPMHGPELPQTPVQQVVPIQQTPPAVNVVPVQGQVQQQPVMVQVEPIQQSMQAPTAVPTQLQTYTMEQLAVAATQLVDAGRRTELVNLLTSFGVQALTALPKEQYGNFATQLRAMGAKI